MQRVALVGVAILLTPVLIIVLVLAAFGGASVSNLVPLCGVGAAGQTVNGQTREVGQWDETQVSSAIAIMNAAGDLGISRREQQIGATTAIGESTLTLLIQGDSAAPDSRGMFQQR